MINLQYIRDITNGVSSYRGDCPNCGGRNTFSASKVDGKILYYCFRASCGLKGKTNYELSIDDLRNVSSTLSSSVWNSAKDRERLENAEGRQRGWAIPEYFTSPLQNNACLKLLSRYSLTDYYARHPETIRYDPKLDRLVFILKDHKGVKGATGRSLSFGVYPRWHIYERIASCPFIPNSAEKSGNAILVEDCISACCLASMVCSICILGTNVPDELIQYILPYNRLYVALDDDATKKSIAIQKKLSQYKETHIIPLRKDIKYYSKLELQELIKGALNG